MKLFSFVASAMTLLVGTCAVQAQDMTPIKFTLDWTVSSGHTWFYMARDKGYFKEEGLDVTIDQGEGSAAAVTRVMSGAYDAGFTDINAVIQNASQRPGEQPIMVYLLFNKAAFAASTLADSPIHTLKDFEGHTLGAPAGSVSLRLFTALANINGVDASKIEIVNLSPTIVERTLSQKSVDSVTSFTATSLLNYEALGLDPDKDIRWFNYDELGLNLYSSGVVVSQELAKNKPDAVSGLVRAINRAVKDVLADPDAAIADLQKVEPLLNPEIERKRLGFFIDKQMRTEESEKIGIGDLDDSRLAESMKIIAEAYDLPRVPEPGEVFNRSFLPPLADRKLVGAN